MPPKKASPKIRRPLYLIYRRTHNRIAHFPRNMFPPYTRFFVLHLLLLLPGLARFVEESSPSTGSLYANAMLSFEFLMMLFFLRHNQKFYGPPTLYTHTTVYKVPAAKLHCKDEDKAYSRVRCTFRMLMANSSRMQFRVAQDIATWQRRAL